tara:strand:+ start:53 stop:265 length:213 start_codon:yes stop_codon:yes gene_type:complete
MKRLWEATKTEYRGNKNFRRKMNSKFIGYPLVVLGLLGIEVGIFFVIIGAIGIGIVIWGISIEIKGDDWV